MSAKTKMTDAPTAEMCSAVIDLLTLQVWTFNKEAQAFFCRQGFTPCMARLWNRKGP
jgi:hypothetical protein